MNTQENFKCSVCGKEFPKTLLYEDKNGKSICRTCKKHKKRKMLIFVSLLIVALIAACVYLYVNNSKVEGNNQTVNIETPEVQVQDIPNFDMASATAVAPSNVGATIDNLQSFVKAMEQRKNEAEETGASDIVIDNISIFFDFNKTELNHDAKDFILAYVNAYKKTNNKAIISIEGYGCNIGSNGANDYISKMRTLAVKDYMVENGIPEGNIESNWYGKSKNYKFNYPENKDYRRVIIGIK